MVTRVSEVRVTNHAGARSMPVPLCTHSQSVIMPPCNVISDALCN